MSASFAERPEGTGICVLGGGLAGLSAAYHLGGECELFERAPELGGHCRTHRADGFSFDEGAHVFFGQDDCSREFVWEPLAGELIEHTAEIWNDYGGGRMGRYPVQVNAHALPPEQATRCVLDFVAAASRPEGEVHDYAAWCRASFGTAFSEEFFLRYARKVWTVEPEELSVEWLGSKVGGRISRPNLEQVLRGAIDREPQTLNYLTRFSYPTAGGFERIAAKLIGGVHRARTGCGVTVVDTAARVLTLADGTTRRYESAISTLPLPVVVSLAVDAPAEVRAAAACLMWTSIRCVNLGIEREDVGPGHWVYFYDADIPFFRVSFPSRLSPGNAPPGCGSLTCEIAYSRRRPLEERGLVPRCLDALRREGLLRPDDRLRVVDQVDAPFGYVVFDHQRTAAVAAIHGWMRSAGLEPCGRFGEWGYHWSFEAIESGQRVARAVAARHGLPCR